MHEEALNRYNKFKFAVVDVHDGCKTSPTNIAVSANHKSKFLECTYK